MKYLVSSCVILYLLLLPITSCHAKAECGSSQGLTKVSCRNWDSRYKEDCSFYQATSTLEWKPHPDRYLLMGCTFGQESNRVYCLQLSLYLAGVLNRTLLFTGKPIFNGIKIDRHIFFDHQHTRQCFGSHSVVTVSEYFKKHGQPPLVDKIRLLVPTANKPPLFLSDNDKFNRSIPFGDTVLLDSIRSLIDKEDALVTPGIEVETVSRPRNGTLFSVEDVIAEYGNLSAKVLFIGEGFIMHRNIEHPELGDWYSRLPFNRLPGCPNGVDVQPHPVIFGAAELIIKNTRALQGTYLGYHMRLGDFDRELLKDAYRSPAQIGKDVLKVMAYTGLHSVFLTTNGSPVEIEQFTSAVLTGGLNLTRITRVKWQDKLLTDYLGSQNVSISPSVVVNIEKVLAMLSTVFVRSSFSTFSTDIQRLRYGFNRTSCFDHTLYFEKIQ